VVLAKSYRLDYENPLALGFDILDGTVRIQVPEVKPGNDYTIVVFGDSGNHGKTFTITQ